MDWLIGFMLICAFIVIYFVGGSDPIDDLIDNN